MHGPILSIDLLERAKRSETFPADWTHERRLRALQRYERFLRLVAAHPDTPLAPTRDIDEMWHLHMLSPVAYFNDCTRLLGTILDHDGGFGSVPEEVPQLRATFEQTAQLWREMYDEPYVDVAFVDAGATSCWHDCSGRCWHACKSNRAPSLVAA